MEARLSQPVQHLHDAGVGGGLVLHVEEVVGPEIAEAFGGQRLRGALGHSTGDEPAHSVAHKAADLVQGPAGQAVDCEGVIGAVGQVLEGVQQGAVQVKDRGVKSHVNPPFRRTVRHR